MKAKAQSSNEPSNQSSQSIAELTEAFLKSGGKIEEVPNGVSGQQPQKGRQHIRIGNN